MRRVFAALCLALLAACASTADEPESERVLPDLVAAEDLSDAKRELLVAYGRGGDDWHAARETALADPELARFMVDNLTVEMLRAYVALAAPGADGARAAYERAQLELVKFKDESTEVLITLLEVADDVIASVAAQTLERIGRPVVAPALARLEAPEPIVRRRMAALLARLPHGASLEDEVRQALGDRLSRDPDWIVRVEAARALGARGARDRSLTPAREALEPALLDEDDYVAGATAESLAALGDPMAIRALIRALGRAVENGEPRLVRAIEGTLRTLSGERRPLDLEGWRDWWYEHRDAIRRADAGQ